MLFSQYFKSFLYIQSHLVMFLAIFVMNAINVILLKYVVFTGHRLGLTFGGLNCIVSSPVFRSFEIIILSFKSDYNSFVAACVYRPPDSCTTQFLEDFLALSGFLSLTGSSFIICGDINVHLDIECGDRSRFNDILQCCSLVLSVSGQTHLLGHTLDVLISPCDPDFVRNVSVGGFNF